MENNKFLDFISHIKLRYPKTEVLEDIHNCHDFDLQTTPNIIRQYILGVTYSDPYTKDFRRYEAQIIQRLGFRPFNAVCLPLYVDNKQEAEPYLKELGNYFGIPVDLQRLYNKGLFESNERNADESFVIIVTVVEIQVLSIYNVSK